MIDRCLFDDDSYLDLGQRITRYLASQVFQEYAFLLTSPLTSEKVILKKFELPAAFSRIQIVPV
jgi:hypothetical protein